MERLTTQTFIYKAKKIHGDLYDYSLVDYKNHRSLVKMICKKHGVFKQIPDYHLRKSGCQKCAKENLGVNRRKDLKVFLEEVKKTHGEKYDYSLVVYTQSKTNVKIICSIHGVFEQSPYVHISGGECHKCSYIKRGLKGRLTIDFFIKKANEVHNNKYDYSQTNYKTILEKILITCPKHGQFQQEANSHLKGSGCPRCKMSKGEKMVKLFLESNDINFIMQKKFKKCKDKNMLSFDFYLHDYNLCVEFDGIQHRKPVSVFGGEAGLNDRKKKDKIKTEFCKNNKIKLIRINSLRSISKKLSFLKDD